MNTDIVYISSIATKENCKDDKTIIYIKDDVHRVINKNNIYMFEEDRIIMDNEGGSILLGIEWLYSQLCCLRPVSLSSIFEKQTLELRNALYRSSLLLESIKNVREILNSNDDNSIYNGVSNVLDENLFILNKIL